MSTQVKCQPLYLKLLINGFLITWLVMAAFPFLWTAWGSFKIEADFFSKADWTNPDRGHDHSGAWQCVYRRRLLRCLGNRRILARRFKHADRRSLPSVSLTFGTLGGYALACSAYRYAFWVLLIALVFWAMPLITWHLVICRYFLN